MSYFCTECVELVETGLNCATCKNGYCYSCSKKSFEGGVCHNCRRGPKRWVTDGEYAEDEHEDEAEMSLSPWGDMGRLYYDRSWDNDIHEDNN